MKERLISLRQTGAAIGALALASVLSCGLVVVRGLHQPRHPFPFYFWNLFLAWIPLAASLLVYAMAARGERNRLIYAGAGLLWFLFFPNAPYIVTDLVHLHARPPVPYWFDMIMIMAFALTGLFIGYLSLYLMQEVVRAWLGRWMGWTFAMGMLGLSAFGIYLGRFLRWNSWDALREPVDVLVGAVRLANPWKNPEPLTFSATFFAFSLVCYLIVYSFTHLHGWVKGREIATPPEEKPVVAGNDLA